MLNPKAVGERVEAIVLAELVKRGVAVSLPFGNNQRYDLVVDDGAGLKKAQVKSGRLTNGAVKFNVCSANGFSGKSRPYAGEVDLFLVYCEDTPKVYNVPAHTVGSKTCSRRLVASRNNRATRVRWAKDYEL